MYCFDSVVRYSEIDACRHMTLSSILDLMQDCCTFHSEELGIGLDYLRQTHRAWVLSFWQIVIDRFPGMGERLKAYTWPYDFKGFMGYRNFKIEDGMGKMVAHANSIWTFLDTDAGRPVKVPEEVRQRYVFEPRYEMAYADRKIRPLGEMDAKEPLRVGRFHIDTNRHVNNGKYIMMAEEYLPEGFKVRELRAEYKRAAVLSDVICPKVKETEQKIIVSLENEAGEPYTLIEFMEGKNEFRRKTNACYCKKS